MLRTLLALSVLALLPPTQALAGPPEGVSKRTVYDDVADGLRKYRKENDRVKRILWLRKLAPTNDPRVAVALGEAMKEDSEVGFDASALIYENDYMQLFPVTDPSQHNPLDWWKENEADLRRRAKQLPQ
jgi:hypothetical protein